MRKIILITILSCIGAVTVIGQCVFPDYDSYGLICDEARFLCGYEMDGYTGSLLVDNSPQPQPDPLCSGQGQADNIQWFSFIPDDTIVQITIRYSNCTNNVLDPGLQVGIFESCELDGDNAPVGSIFCQEGTNYSDITLTPDPADIEVGQLYLFFVDGFAGSACDFEIDVIEGICTDEPDTTTVCEQDCGVVTQDDNGSGCTMFIDTFSFVPTAQLLGGAGGCFSDPDSLNSMLDSIICVEWNIQPDTGFIILSEAYQYFDSLGVLPTLIIEWTLPGTYTIEPIIHFNPLFESCAGGCGCTDDVVFTYTVNETTIVDLPELELCPGECVNFCDETYCDTGTYECRYRELCLIELQSVVTKSNIEIDEGIHFLCPGECFEFQDVQYCNADNYEISNAQSCDTTYFFQLEELTFSIDLARADDLINCTIFEAFLEGEWNTNFTGNIMSAWISETGDTIGFGTEYTATDAGEYTFVAWPENMKSCEISIAHIVDKDDEVPSVNLIPPFLDCNNLLDSIFVDTQVNITSIDWSGPNGFLSNDINLEVDEAGMYEATVTATNGCKTIIQTEVLGDFETPSLAVDFDNLTCSDEIPLAFYSSNLSIESHIWIAPDASQSTTNALALGSAGNYSLQVTGTNGCTATEFFNVLDLSYDPSLHLNQDKIWRCMDTSIDIDLSAQEVQGMTYGWTSLAGDVLSNEINLTITSPGTYILTTIDDDLQCIGYDTVRTVEDPNPFLDIDYAILPPLCKDGLDGSVDVMTIGGGTGPYTYEIDGEQIAEENIADVEFEAGEYSIKAIDAFGCEVIKKIEVPSTSAFTVDTEPELSIRFGQSKTMTFETSLEDNEIGLIEWTNPEGEILGIGRELDFVGDNIDVIYLRVENLDGCEITTEVRVDLSFDVDIYYPNVFSPNKDGNNDLFILYNNGFPEMADDLKIFDRAGELIYRSTQTEFNETKEGWDGTFNGQPCQPGVYVFILQYTLMNGRKERTSGSITLVR